MRVTKKVRAKRVKFITDDVSLLLKALRFAANKHRAQRRNDDVGSPYIIHPIVVAETLWGLGEVRDINTIIAAILHDTIEDTDTTPDEIKAGFGKEIRALVEEVTDDKKLPKEVRKQLQIDRAGKLSLSARQIELADKICNIKDIIDSPPAHWPLERRLEYITWARQVVNRIRGCNGSLELLFSELSEKAIIACRDVEQVLIEEQ